MSIKPKKHIADLHRVANPSFNRSEYLPLDKNENIIGFPEEVLQAFRDMMTPDFIAAYPDVAPLYRKLSEQMGVDPSQIYLSSGSDAGIKSVFEVYVEADDEVILTSPTYAMYYVYTKMFQARLVEIFYNKNLFISPGEIIAKISSKTKLVCIPNPNSSTGTIFSQDDLLNIIKAANEFDALVLVDEAYKPFLEQTMLDFISEHDNLLIARSFSKARGLASARLGYIVGSKKIVRHLHKVRPLYETNSFAVHFGIHLLDHPEIMQSHVQQISQAKTYLTKKLQELGLSVKKGSGNFVLINVNGREKAEAIVKLLFREKVLIKGGFKEPCLENYIRVSVGSFKQMEVFVEKLTRILNEVSDQVT